MKVAPIVLILLIAAVDARARNRTESDHAYDLSGSFSGSVIMEGPCAIEKPFKNLKVVATPRKSLIRPRVLASPVKEDGSFAITHRQDYVDYTLTLVDFKHAREIRSTKVAAYHGPKTLEFKVDCAKEILPYEKLMR